MNKNNGTSLAENALGIGESIVMGTAGAAPAFSISAATATLVASVGTLAPASILYCGIMMFGIILAFMHLNKLMVNAGASYAWVSHIFGKQLGFFAGWALMVASAVFMVSGSTPAATATLRLFAPELVHHLNAVTLVAALWLTLIAIVVVKGIKAASYLQVVMTGVEVIVLIAIIIGGFYQYIKLPAHPISVSWFSLTAFTPSLFATGALTAVFFYWGWDVTLNLNEETKNAKHAPGWGAFWSILIIILLFMLFMVTTLLVLSDREIQSSGTNVVVALMDKIFPKPWGMLAILSIIFSSVGTLETTILQFTRTLFSQGRDKILHPRYATLHQTWNTPWLAVVFIWMFGMIFLFLSTYFSTINDLIKVSVDAIGFQVAFYYSLTGFACAWYYRKMWKNSLELFGYVIWPIASSVFLSFIAIYSIPTFDTITIIVGMGGIVLGFIPYFINQHVNGLEAL